jgi:class 3 adenylate cyclase
VPELPRGTVTLVVTDMRGSTALADRLGSRWTEVFGEHNRVLRGAVAEAGGIEVERAGDSFIFAFERARAAVAGALACQRDLADLRSREPLLPPVAIGLHTGEPESFEGGYAGAMVHRAVRITALAGGGEIVLSDTTRQLVLDDLPAGTELRDLGLKPLEGLSRPEHLHRLVTPELDHSEALVPMRSLPAGTVTFLFTDIERSTELQRRLGERWAEAHATHHRLVREAIVAGEGREVDTQGDAFFAVFTRARSAISACASAQRSLQQHEWPGGADLRVRMGVHTGEPTVGGEGYLGLDVVRAARICSLASGGQVLVSESTRALVRGEDLGAVSLQDLGEHRLKDFEEPERLFQLTGSGLRTAPLPAPDAPAKPAVPALDVGNRGEELAARALEATKDLEGLGPAIHKSVEDMLKRAGIPRPAVEAIEAEAGPPQRRRWWQRGRD